MQVSGEVLFGLKEREGCNEREVRTGSADQAYADQSSDSAGQDHVAEGAARHCGHQRRRGDGPRWRAAQETRGRGAQAGVKPRCWAWVCRHFLGDQYESQIVEGSSSPKESGFRAVLAQPGPAQHLGKEVSSQPCPETSQGEPAPGPAGGLTP